MKTEIILFPNDGKDFENEKPFRVVEGILLRDSGVLTIEVAAGHLPALQIYNIITSRDLVSFSGQAVRKLWVSPASEPTTQKFWICG